VALIVGDGDLVVRAHAHAIGGAKAGAEDLAFVAVARDFHDAAMVGLRERHLVAGDGVVVEVSVAIGLKVHVERVIVGIGDGVVVEIFVEVGFAVVVEIVEAGDLVSSEDVNHVVDDLQAERLIEAGGEAFPFDVIELGVEAGDEPDVAAEGGDGGAAVGEEVKSAGFDPGFPGVFIGEGHGCR